MKFPILYRHFSESGELLYIGVSMKIFTRINSHKISPWMADVRRIEIEHFKEMWQALDAEKKAIKTEFPLHNKMHKDMAVFNEIKETDNFKKRQSSKHPKDYGSIAKRKTFNSLTLEQMELIKTDSRTAYIVADEYGITTPCVLLLRLGGMYERCTTQRNNDGRD
jgi:excinuclease UvrABC nuclease subunit